MTDTLPSPKLDPCPFCGGSARFEHDCHDDILYPPRPFWHVRTACGDCGIAHDWRIYGVQQGDVIRTVDPVARAEAEAAEAAQWNRRAPRKPEPCPIGLDHVPHLCSAGTCDGCIRRRIAALGEELAAALKDLDLARADSRRLDVLAGSGIVRDALLAFRSNQLSGSGRSGDPVLTEGAVLRQVIDTLEQAGG